MRLRLLLVTLFIGIASQSFSSHLIGMGVYYRHLDSLNYEVTLHFYRYCGGTIFNGTPTSASTGVSSQYTYYVASSGQQVTYIASVDTSYEVGVFCPQMAPFLSSCQAGWQTGIMGVNLTILKDTIDVSQISGYGAGDVIRYFSGARTTSTSLVSQPSMVSEASIDPTSYNSTPYPLNVQIPFVYGDSVPSSMSFQEYDLDGDSLVFELDTAISSFNLTAGYTYCNYTNNFFPFSGLQPMHNISLDASTGIFSMIPEIPSTLDNANYPIAWKVHQYDTATNQYRGYIHQDVQLIVVGDSNVFLPYQSSAIMNVTGASLTSASSLALCIGDSFSYEVEFSDSSSTDTLIGQLGFDTSLFELSLQKTGSNPSLFKVSGYTKPGYSYAAGITLNVRDNYCPWSGVSNFSVVVDAVCSLVEYDTVLLCEGLWTEVMYGADSLAVWNVISGDPINSGNFNCLVPSCNQVELSPDSTTVYEVQQFLTNGNSYVDTFTVLVTQTPQVDIVTFGSLCAGDSIGLKAIVENADSFDIQWHDSLNIIFDDFADSTSVYNDSAGLFSIPYEIEVNQTCHVEDTFELEINAIPEWGGFLSLPDSICVGDSFQFVSVPSQDYMYSPSIGLTSDTGNPFCAVLDTITYHISYTDVNGCGSDTSITIEPLKNYLIGSAIDSSGAGISSGKVLMIGYDFPNDSVYIADSSDLDVNGGFAFNPKLALFFIKVIPDSASYPFLVPTYFDSAAVVQNASYFFTEFCDTSMVEIQALSGANPGGSGFIGGIVSQGAGRGVGDPVKHLSVLLYDESQETYMWTSTNDDGYFNFEGLSSGSYRVWVDKWGVKNWIAPLFEIGESDVLDSLQFTLYSDRLVHETPAGITEKTKEFKVFPNPVSSRLHIESDSWPLSFVVYDLVGRVVFESYSQSESDLDLSSIEPGSYILHSTDSDGEQHSSTLIKSAR